MTSPLPDGILLIDKPVGITSFDVIRRLRSEWGAQKRGHAGTLDPLASGLLIIGEGRATKLLTQYLKLPKEYEAEVYVGEQTTTGDREGEVIEHAPVGILTERALTEALQSMVGTLTLPVSIYSAIKQSGEPLYKKARRGEEVQAPERTMVVTSATLLAHEPVGEHHLVHVRFTVGSGTYIRSLAEEFGRRLGYPARLENLRRTKIGEYRVEDAIVV